MKTFLPAFNNTATIRQHTSSIVYCVKMFVVLTITIFILVIKGSCADSTHITGKNAFYLQVAGKGNPQSINYDRVFRQGRLLNYSFSIGISPASKSFSVPVGLNAFTTGKQHHFEMSLALIPYIEKHTFDNGTDLDKQLYIKPLIGYRYQKLHSGLFIKAGLGPQIFMDPPSSDFWAFTPKLLGLSAQLGLGISF